ncbi:DUF2577 family protein [Paenibacillus sanguinis]|uniref:DUF2577 family protein n=1 Tax=Paenibacillus sanguinis TaxID=225906 RepID=UPI00036DA18C|nr:DUF2577 family protein [Paenibacillus sanguinis]
MLVQVVKEAARQAVDSAMPLRILEAVVVSPPPALSIQLAGDQRMIIPAELLLVAERLETGLRTGDEVLIFAVQGGQTYYLADRVVRYANS